MRKTPFIVGETAPDLKSLFPYTVRDANGWSVAAVFGSEDKALASAKLLAAAPLMADALKAFLTAFGTGATTKLSTQDLGIELLEATVALLEAGVL